MEGRLGKGKRGGWGRVGEGHIGSSSRPGLFTLASSKVPTESLAQRLLYDIC